VSRITGTQPGAVLVSDSEYLIDNTIHNHDKAAVEFHLVSMFMSKYPQKKRK
jgi:hypothetical protein